MALRQRIYFFDPSNLDRFNDKDIPTEDTMRDWSESVPFILEIGDRSQLTRAGISKTTTNDKVRTRDDDDQGGVSPTGFTTFVKPSQLPLLLSTDNSIAIAEVGRLGTDDGTGDITDYDLSVNFPGLPPIPEDTDDINLTQDYDVWGFNETGSVCDPSYGSSQNSVLNNQNLTDLLLAYRQSLEELSSALETVKEKLCEESVAVGDIVMTVIPPVEWDDSWLEPRGQLIAIANYPVLFGLIGNVYGGSAPNFALPDLSNDKYLRAKLSTAGVVNSSGGSNTYTLSQVNIPLHSHTFSGTTNTDGAHTHPIPTRGVNGNSDSARKGDLANDSFNLASSGSHNHSFNGTTAAYGQNPPDPVVVEPAYNHVYLKMKVK